MREIQIKDLPRDVVALALDKLDGNEISDIAIGVQLNLPIGVVLIFIRSGISPSPRTAIYYNENGLVIPVNKPNEIEMIFKSSNLELDTELLIKIIGGIPADHISSENIRAYSEKIQKYKTLVDEAVISTERIELFFINRPREEFQKWTIYPDRSIKVETIEGRIDIIMLM